jgi:PAS domain S-box-containing protein
MPNRHTHKKSAMQPDYAEQLLLYQQRISNILESFTDAFFEVDQNWIVTYWNKEAEKLLLMPREQVLGKNLWSVYAEAVPLKFYTEYHRAVKENVSVRFEEYFEPRKIWVEVAAFPSGDSLSVYFKDITARKNANLLLKAEKQKYQDLFNFSPIPQWVFDIETLAFLQVNEAAITQYGYSREEFMQMTIKDIRPAEELPAMYNIINTTPKGEYHQSEVIHRKKNGEIIYVVVEGNTVSFEGRNARLVLAVDHTEEIKAKQQLELSLSRYDIVAKATSDAIWDWDIQTKTLTWNKGINEIFGYQDIEFDYQWWRSNVHPDDLPFVEKKFDELSKSKNSRQQLEYRFRCADGNYKTVLDRSFILFDAEGNAVRMIGSMQDITDRIRDMKAIEARNERLLEISWLQSHKVRAPLARILGLAALLDIDNCSDIIEMRELIRHISDSANDLDIVIKEIADKAQLPKSN